MKKAFIVTFEISTRVTVDVPESYDSTKPIDNKTWNRITSAATDILDTSDLSGNVSAITEDEEQKDADNE